MKTYCLHDPPYVKHQDIGALQHALKQAGLYKGPIDDTFGPSTGRSCRDARYRLGYPKSALIFCGGQTLLDYLHGTTKLPSTYLVRRHLRGYGLTKEQEIRAAIVGHALWAVQHEPQIHYAQVRPDDQLHHVRPLPWYTDCSEFVTTIYKWAGGPDPNGMGFNGYGNTDSMANHGHTIALWEAEPGDVVIWGTFTKWGFWTHHTAVIVDTTNRVDPLVVSHGQERGPIKLHLSTETGYQHRSYIIKNYF